MEDAVRIVSLTGKVKGLSVVTVYCLVLCAFLLAAAPAGRAAEDAGKGDDAAIAPKPGAPEENATWMTILDGVKRDMALRESQLGVIRDALPDFKKELNHGLAKADNRLDQILLLRGVAGRTPWAQRTILIQYRELIRYIELKKAPLKEKKDLLARTKREYSTIRTIRTQGAGEKYAEGTQESLQDTAVDFRDLKRDVSEVKDEVDKALLTADNLIAQVQKALDLDVDHYIEILTEYYFAPSGGLLTLRGWDMLTSDMAEWSNNCVRFWRPLLTWVEWGDFFLYLVAYALVFLMAGRLFGRYLSKRGVVEIDGYKRYLTGWRFFSVALAVLLAARSTIFTNNMLVAMVWVSLMTLGLTRISTAFLSARDGHDDEGRLADSPLFTLWALFAAGEAIEVLNIPASGINCFWLAALCLAIWRLMILRKRACIPGERSSIGWSVWLLTLFAVLTPFGWGAQTLIMSQAWYMLLLTFYLGAALRPVVMGLASAGDEGGGDPAARRSYVTLAYPFLLTVMYFLYVAWVLTFMGGPGFMDYVLALSVKVGQASISLEAIGYLFIAFFLVRLALSWFKSFLEMASYRGKKVDAALAHTINTVLSYVMWVAFVIAGMGLFGLSLSALTWIASGLSVGIGFGLKDIVNNFISGLIIMFGGSIKKGDILQQGKNLGEVVHVSVRNTTMRTMENTIVIIPNSSFLKGEIINYSYQDAKMRLAIPVSVAPGTKLKKVKKILLEVAKENPDVLSKPKPDVLFQGFSQFGLDFTLYVWIGNYMQKFKIINDMTWEIDQKFQENKIIIAFRTIKTKYKPKGSEAQQLEAQRAALKEKRKSVFKKTRHLRRTHARKKWNEAGYIVQTPE